MRWMLRNGEKRNRQSHFISNFMLSLYKCKIPPTRQASMVKTNMMMFLGHGSSVVICLLYLMEVASCTGFNSIKFRQEVEDVLQLKRKIIAKQHLQEHPLYRYHHHGVQTDSFSGPLYPDMYLVQPLDHFDSQEVGTYKQRYWVNKDHWKGSGGPVFLYIGGEGGLTSDIVQSGEHYDLAVKYGALIFAVEHRYYGKSINPGGLELHNIQYLSSQQALADLSSFHSFASKEYNLVDDNLWICFGGSYPGSLSAWFRIKYPHLVYGAIATSAPVLADVNNEGYNDVVTNSLSDPVVKGSKLCAQKIREAFKTLDTLLDKEQYEQVSKDFKSCSVVKEPKDVYQLVSNVAAVFLVTVQYNNVEWGRNVESLCGEMTKSGDSYDNLKNLYETVVNTENCTDNLWANYIKMLSNTSTTETGVSIRAWVYQTCTQFGYYQTCDPETSCLFSHRMTLEPNLAICKEVFDIDPEKVYDSVEFTNSYYGGDHPAGTRIVFVNGSIDPWHALSVLRNISSTETAIFINGTSHCANMESQGMFDPPSLKHARKEIDAQIGMWLEEADGQVLTKDTNLYFRPL